MVVQFATNIFQTYTPRLHWIYYLIINKIFRNYFKKYSKFE